MPVWGLTAGAILREFAANAAMSVPTIRRRRLSTPRTGSTSLGHEAAKIIAQFDFLAGSAGDLAGRTVVEIGPGDAVGLAPLFLLAGCERYVAFDRFLGNVWGRRALALYDEIASRRGPFEPDWRDRVDMFPFSIEDAHEKPLAADLVVSFDVIEHLANLPRAIRNMAALLAPHGVMVHRIDYGPHGVWLSASDPLSFLSVPGWLWRAIGSNRGYPNRARHPDLMRLLRDEGLHMSDRVTRAYASDVMDAEVVCGFAAAPRLGPPFRFEPDQNR